MADHDDDLTERFRSLDGVEVPPWRERVQARSDAVELDPGGASVGRGWRGPLAVAAVAAVVALVAWLAIWPDDDGGDPIVAGPAAGFGELPTTEDRLMCPPALLDVGDLFADVAGGPRVVSQPATTDGPSPYVLQWVQDGRDVSLSYPGPSIRTADLPPTEHLTLGGPEGTSVRRTARLEYRSSLTADVLPFGGPDELCDGFWISVSGDGGTIEPPAGAGPGLQPGGAAAGPGDDTTTSIGSGPPVPPATQPIRDLLIEVATSVQIRAPEGSVEVPDVEGMPAFEAQDALARAGLVPAGDAPICCDSEPRPVTDQSPGAGEVVPIGAPVSLHLLVHTTSTTEPPEASDDVVLPVPEEPIVCPIGRLRVTSGVHSTPEPVYGQTIEWQGARQTTVHVSWPSWEFRSDGGHATRALEVDGRAALMHDGGDGQNLVYDTGLPDGACRFIQVGVFGGDSIEGREELAVELAEGSIVLDAPPEGAPPDVVGLSVAAAADRLARAGFVPDWGYRPAVGDEPVAPPDDVTVRAQRPAGADGVVVLEV